VSVEPGGCIACLHVLGMCKDGDKDQPISQNGFCDNVEIMISCELTDLFF